VAVPPVTGGANRRIPGRAQALEDLGRMVGTPGLDHHLHARLAYRQFDAVAHVLDLEEVGPRARQLALDESPLEGATDRREASQPAGRT